MIGELVAGLSKIIILIVILVALAIGFLTLGIFTLIGLLLLIGGFLGVIKRVPVPIHFSIVLMLVGFLIIIVDYFNFL